MKMSIKYSYMGTYFKLTCECGLDAFSFPPWAGEALGGSCTFWNLMS